MWELIDGLQRVSTILEFVGVLVGADGNTAPPLELEGTNLLPSLAEVHWTERADPDAKCFTPAQQLDLKRARLRVEILKKESDEEAKFELFQRLNTGGSHLSDQEVRNCVLVMVSPDFYQWLGDLTVMPEFEATVTLTETAKSEQKHLELALRHVAYRRVPYSPGLDVNEYLDKAALQLARLPLKDRQAEASVVRTTFGLLAAALGADSFRKWDGTRHVGGFLISGFDAIAHGISCNLSAIVALQDTQEWVRSRARAVWAEEAFRRNSGMGVRGTTRLMNLLPFGEAFFRP